MGKKVLLVDDSTVSRMLLRGLIREKRPDWEISEARNAEEALDKVREQPPDLVTLDIGMPGMSGLELAVKLKEACPAAQMAVVTANIQNTVRRKIQGLGILFVAVIEKPATAEAIEQMLFFVDAND